MPTPSVTYNFAPLTDILSSEVDQNFEDLVDFISTNCVQKDASLAFTATPAGPALDPVSDNQFARKAYVDKVRVLTPRQVLTGASAAYGAGPVDTDFVLASVMVSSARAYEVCLHSRLDFSSPGEFQFNLHVDGVATQRLDHKPVVGGDGQQMTAVSPLWLPSSGTYTLRVNVTRVSGTGTVTFLATASAPRSFYVKDIGLR